MKRKIFGAFLFAALALFCLLALPTEVKAASENDLTFASNDLNLSY